MMMMWSFVNTDCQEAEETVELEMTGLANSSDVTVSEKSFQMKANLLFNKGKPLFKKKLGFNEKLSQNGGPPPLVLYLWNPYSDF